MSDNKPRSAKEARRLFKEKAGELLLPQGFFYKQGCYYRIHPGKFILCVNLFFYYGGGFDILHDSGLFCEGAEHVLNPDGWRITEVAALAGLPRINPFFTPYDELMEIELEAFHKAAEDFISIQSLEQDYRYRQWIRRGAAIGNYGIALECLQIGEYQSALRHLAWTLENEKHLQAGDEGRYTKILTYYRDSKTTDEKQKYERAAEIQKTEIEARSKKIRLLETRYKQFLNGDYSGAQEDFEENCKTTDATCRREFGRVYTKLVD